jgi:CheY-like chemotaxis protein
MADCGTRFTASTVHRLTGSAVPQFQGSTFRAHKEIPYRETSRAPVHSVPNSRQTDGAMPNSISLELDSDIPTCRACTDARLDVVIVYDDARAGRHAVRVIEEVTGQLGEETNLHPVLWRFDLLEDPDWSAAAAAEAAQAGLIIIFASSKGSLPVAVQRWVQECLQPGAEPSAALIALLGPANDLDPLDSPRVQFLKSAAETAGFSFFAPAPQVETPPASQTGNEPGMASGSQPAANLSRRILLVEDHRPVRELSTRALVDAGYQVDAVESGQSG